MYASLAIHTGCGGHDSAVPKRLEEPPTVRKSVLHSSLAGRWYPASATALRSMLESLWPSDAKPHPQPVCAAIVPHAGYQFSGAVAAQTIARLDPKAYDRVLILAPSHYLALPNAVSVPECTHIATPLGEVALDVALAERLRALPEVESDERAHDREHSVQIQLPLLQQHFGNRLQVVPIVVGQMTPKTAQTFGKRLRQCLDPQTLVLVSSDFTHYGPQYEYVPFTNDVPRRIEELDHAIFERFAQHDGDGFWHLLAETGATVCGRHAIGILLAMLPPEAKVLKTAYDTSGNMLGSWDNSVSYLGALVEGRWTKSVTDAGASSAMLPASARKTLLQLARDTLEYCVRGDDLPTPEEADIRITPELEQIMGGFVTLKIRGALRGCIGEIQPRRPIWEVVREQTVNAACNDPRFAPVTQHETPSITIEISALTPPRPVSSWREIDVGRHGVVLARQGRSAVFLPQVAPEQGWDRETMLNHLARKAGLPDDAWRTGAAFMVFEAEVFHE